MMKHYLTLLAFFTVALLATSCARTEPAVKSSELGPSKSNMRPEPDMFYTLVMPPMLYETHRPGPKGQESSQAWAVANEFVFRTSLRETTVLPATSVTPAKTGYLVQFDTKDGTADRKVFVRGDLKAAELIKE